MESYNFAIVAVPQNLGPDEKKKQYTPYNKDSGPLKIDTCPKFNIAPEKWWLEDEFPFGIAYF